MTTVVGRAPWDHDDVSTAASSPTMIGREADLGVLRTVFADVALGNPRGVVVGGEAGIGKTRLLKEFMAQTARSALVLTGQCVDLGDAGTPFAPVTSVLRGLVEHAGRDELLTAAGPGSDALQVLLPELGLEVAHQDVNLNRLHEAVATTLGAASRREPVVVVIEDAQWADDATLKVMQFVLRTLVGVRVMVVLSYRSDDVPRGHRLHGFLTGLERSRRILRVELGRLSREQVHALAEAILGQAPDATVLERVYERSDGVPFFVEELLGLEETCSGDALPDTLRELLVARYERLTEPTQAVLRLISVGGVRVPHDLLVAVHDAGAAALDVAAREAVGARVLVVDEQSYAFRHALVREAVSSDLLPGERARFHTRYAEELERRASPARVATEIAYHWYAAHNPAKAFPATLAAMAEALPTFAYLTAAQLGERALELWDQVPDASAVAGRTHYDLFAETAAALSNAGDGERALAMLELALAECPQSERERRAELLRAKAHYLANIGRPGSIPLLEEALTLLPDGSTGTLRAKILGSLAGRLMIEAQMGRAIAVAREALAEAKTAGSARHSSIAANLLGLLRVQTGEVAEGLADLDCARVLAHGDHSAMLRYLVNTSDLMYLMGRYDEALRIAEEGLASAREQGAERTSGVILASNAVDPLLALGQWDRADELVDRMLAFDTPMAFRLYLRRARVWSMLWRGDVAGAERYYRSWRSSMATLAGVEMQTRLGVARVVGELAMARGDLVQAWEQAEVLLSQRDTPPGHDLPILVLGARVVGALRLSGAADAAELDEREQRLRTVLAKDSFWPTAPVWTAVFEAEVGGPARDGTDVDAWRAAVESVRAPTAQAYLLPYAVFQLGHAHVVAGDRAGAREDLRAAVDAADRIGAGLIRRWAEDVAELAGVDVGAARSQTAAQGPDLTPRERQVLELIGQGLTNRQIGELLFISAKTASVHVSAILRKLGAASRTEAVFLSGAAADRAGRPAS
jgi:DNA-binding CsgD family transcriptional regulator/tetratricopeptide (TPR) repeat protein